MSHPIHQIADINPSFYLDASPAGDYPFDEINTCPVFIAPNFATLKWKNISKHNLNSKIDDLNRIHDKAFFNEYMIYIHVPFCRSFCHYCNFARDSSLGKTGRHWLLILTIFCVSSMLIKRNSPISRTKHSPPSTLVTAVHLRSESKISTSCSAI